MAAKKKVAKKKATKKKPLTVGDYFMTEAQLRATIREELEAQEGRAVRTLQAHTRAIATEMAQRVRENVDETIRQIGLDVTEVVRSETVGRLAEVLSQQKKQVDEQLASALHELAAVKRERDTLIQRNAVLRQGLNAEKEALKAELEALRDHAVRVYEVDVVDVVFDGPPDHEAPRFIEVESPPGKSIRAGEWIKREDGYWALRLDRVVVRTDEVTA